VFKNYVGIKIVHNHIMIGCCY